MIREQASRQLQLPLDYLDKLARSASHRYKSYTVEKRRGGRRQIHHPARELKAVQRWLLHEVFDDWRVHPAAHAYEQGRNIRTNAEEHAGCNYLLRMDFSGFFPSITERDIRCLLIDRGEDWSDRDVLFVVRVVCRNGGLTIGAPTSPKLSNTICFELDTRLTELCNPADVTYTRYADDLYFSTAEKHVLPELEDDIEDVVDDLECPAALEFNEDKTHHASSAGRMEVTGLVLTPDGRVSIGRDRKRRLRSLVYKYEELDEDQREKLAGTLAHVQSVEPEFINRLALKYGGQRVEEAMSMPD